MSYRITVYGKWILAGEYSVLRGSPAIAFPLYSQFIKLGYNKGEVRKKLQIIEVDSVDGVDFLLKSLDKKDPIFTKKTQLTILFNSVLDQALQKISKSYLDLYGVIKLYSGISFGSGLGGSAVICVLIGKLFHSLGWVKKKDLFTFCHSLENNLHGQSSGLDVAIVLAKKPILYQLESKYKKNEVNSEIKELSFLWKPIIFLSYSGSQSATKENIKKVNLLWKNNLKKATVLQQKMKEAVWMAKKGLMADQNHGLNFLIQSFNLAEECFFKWGLITDGMKDHINFLKKKGAIAIKPTGSGSGGFILSLWDKKPPQQLNKLLISAL